MNFEEYKKAKNKAIDCITEAETLVDNLSHLSSYKNEFNKNIKFSVLSMFSNGKSTFLNALLFEEEILPTGMGETTRGAFQIYYGEKNCYEAGSERYDFNDFKGLKKKIENDNEAAKTDKKSFLAKIQVNHPKIKDLEVFDTPGFGSLGEKELESIIQEACQGSDGIIFLFDISKGLTSEDTEKIQKYLSNFGKHITNIPFWTIFNKLDSEEDRSEKELCELMANTLIGLSILKENELSSFVTFEQLASQNAFALSSKKALKSYDNSFDLTKRGELLKSSRFEFFENEFFKKIPKAKIDVFCKKVAECITHFNIERKRYNDKIEIIEKKDFDEQIQNGEHAIQDITKYIEASENCRNQFLKQINLYEESSVELKECNQSPGFKTLCNNINSILKEKLQNNILKYTIFGGDKAEVLVKKAVEDAKPRIEEFINDYFKNRILDKPIRLVAQTEGSIELYNKLSENRKLRKLSVALEKKLKYLGEAIYKIEEDIKKKKFIVDIDSKSFEAVSESIVLSVGSMIISAIVALILVVIVEEILLLVVSRILTFLIPIIGWALGIITAIWAIFGGETTAEKLWKKIEPELDKSLPVEIEKILEQELYAKCITDIDRDVQMIKEQVKKYNSDLEVGTSLAKNNINEAKYLIEKRKEEIQTEIDTCNNNIILIDKYKSCLENTIATK